MALRKLSLLPLSDQLHRSGAQDP